MLRSANVSDESTGLRRTDHGRRISRGSDNNDEGTAQFLGRTSKDRPTGYQIRPFELRILRYFFLASRIKDFFENFASLVPRRSSSSPLTLFIVYYFMSELPPPPPEAYEEEDAGPQSRTFRLLEKTVTAGGA
jgi:hypothetical protein